MPKKQINCHLQFHLQMHAYNVQCHHCALKVLYVTTLQSYEFTRGPVCARVCSGTSDHLRAHTGYIFFIYPISFSQLVGSTAWTAEFLAEIKEKRHVLYIRMLCYHWCRSELKPITRVYCAIESFDSGSPGTENLSHCAEKLIVSRCCHGFFRQWERGIT